MTRIKIVGTDIGNADVKYATENGQGFFRHALAKLSEAQWERATAQGIEAGYYRVNGAPFVVGDKALRVAIHERPKGAIRYNASYIGVLSAIATYEALAPNNRRAYEDVESLVSYPPADYGYMSDLMDAVSGTWEVIGVHGIKRYNCNAIGAFDEPMGGLAHFGLTSDGEIDKRTKATNQTVLVIDVGGYTTDVLPVDVGFIPDYTASSSIRTGVIDMLTDFEQSIRARYRDEFKAVGTLDARRVESALMSGVYKFGKLKLDVVDQSAEVLTASANGVLQAINGAGGAGNYDRILMTGGGSVLLRDIIADALPVIDVELVERNRDLLRFANVDGYLRLFRMLRTTGGI